MEDWARPIRLVQVPLSKALQPKRAKGSHPSVADWWMAAKVQRVAEALAKWRTSQGRTQEHSKARCCGSVTTRMVFKFTRMLSRLSM